MARTTSGIPYFGVRSLPTTYMRQMSSPSSRRTCTAIGSPVRESMCRECLESGDFARSTPFLAYASGTFSVGLAFQLSCDRSQQNGSDASQIGSIPCVWRKCAMSQTALQLHHQQSPYISPSIACIQYSGLVFLKSLGLFATIEQWKLLCSHRRLCMELKPHDIAGPTCYLQMCCSYDLDIRGRRQQHLLERACENGQGGKGM